MNSSVLTSPSEGVSNDGHDNVNSDLILRTGMMLEDSDTQIRYTVQEMLGQGTFGQVVKCTRDEAQEDGLRMPGRGAEPASTTGSGSKGSYVAVKVIKNQPAYYHQALVEISVLKLLNDRYDPLDTRHIVRLIDHFVHKKHLCIVFELLTYNLFELIRQNQFRGLSLKLVRLFTKQLLDALIVLRQARVIHCDLKPENVLLKSLHGDIKLIDFGSACLENRIVYSYIQSRFYRSPEVILGHHYTAAIDMWSLGCLAAELFLGLPLFPGASEFDLLHRMVEALGNQPPDRVLRSSKNTSKFFKHLPRPPPKHTPAPTLKPLTGKGAISATLCSANGPLSPVSENPSDKSFTLSAADDSAGSSPAQAQHSPLDGDTVQPALGQGPAGAGITISWGLGRNCTAAPGTESLDYAGVTVARQGAVSTSNSREGDAVEDATPSVHNPSSVSSSFDSFGNSNSSSSTSPSSLFSSSASSRSASPASSTEYVLLSVEEYAEREKSRPAIGKRYFREKQLVELVLTYSGFTGTGGSGLGMNTDPSASLSSANNSTSTSSSSVKMASGLTASITAAERTERVVFADFLRGLVEMDPEKRWTPQQAVLHPFITELPAALPFVPAPVSAPAAEEFKGASAPGPSGVFSGPASLPSLFSPQLSSWPARALLFTGDHTSEAQAQAAAHLAGQGQQQRGQGLVYLAEAKEAPPAPRPAFGFQPHGAAPVPGPSALAAFQSRQAQQSASSLPQPLAVPWYAAEYHLQHQAAPQAPGPLPLHSLGRLEGAMGSGGGVYHAPGSGDRGWGPGLGVPGPSQVGPGLGSLQPAGASGNLSLLHRPGFAPTVLGAPYSLPLDAPISSGPRLGFVAQDFYASSTSTRTPDGQHLAYHSSDPCRPQGQGGSPSGLPIPDRLRSLSSQSGHQQHFSPVGPPVLLHRGMPGGAQHFQSPASVDGMFLPGSLGSGQGTPLAYPGLHFIHALSPMSTDGLVLPRSLGSSLGTPAVAQGIPVRGGGFGGEGGGGYPALPSSLGSSVGGLPDSRSTSRRLSYAEQAEARRSAEPTPSPPSALLERSQSEDQGQARGPTLDSAGTWRAGGDLNRTRLGLAGIPEVSAPGAPGFVVGQPETGQVPGAGAWPQAYQVQPGTVHTGAGLVVGMASGYVLPGSYPEGGEVVRTHQHVGSPVGLFQPMGSLTQTCQVRARFLPAAQSGMVAQGQGRMSFQPGQAAQSPQAHGRWAQQTSPGSAPEPAEARQDEHSYGDASWGDGTAGAPPEPEDWDPYFTDDLLLSDGSRHGSASSAQAGPAVHEAGRWSSGGPAAEAGLRGGEAYMVSCPGMQGDFSIPPGYHAQALPGGPVAHQFGAAGLPGAAGQGGVQRQGWGRAGQGHYCVDAGDGSMLATGLGLEGRFQKLGLGVCGQRHGAGLKERDTNSRDLAQ